MSPADGAARHAVVVGAGAAGLLAAIAAATAGARVTLLEATPDGGRKILISGGGRCNILPVELDERRFVTDSSPHTLAKLLRAWPLREQAEFFEREAGLPLAIEHETGKRFPSSMRARDVRDRLVALARARGAEFVGGARVTGLVPADPDGPVAAWRVEVQGRPAIVADAVVLATGGLSVPKTGSDGGGLRLAADLGHRVHPTYPALTPITARPHPFADLTGVSLGVTLQADDGRRRARARGGFLFTHKGYSGPTVLDVSHVCVRAHREGGPPARLTACWSDVAPADWERRLRPDGPARLVTPLREVLPARLAEALVRFAGLEPERPRAQLRKDERRRLVDVLTRCGLPWTGDEGYAAAEVTGGGVDLAEVDPRTLESRRHPGLHLCGELLDAFGPIGGYNFAWAWATGRAAGLGAARGVERAAHRG